MILFANYRYDDLQAALNDAAQKSSFERMLLKTRFENYSEYLWLMLNAFKRSFIFDLVEDTETCLKNRIQYERELCELFAFLTSRKAESSIGIDFTDKASGDRVSVGSKRLFDDIFALLRHSYICTIDNEFDPDFDPDDLGGSVYAGLAKESTKPVERQDSAIKSIDCSIKQLSEMEGEFGRRGAPYKNTRIHCALMAMAAMCEPNYNAADIDEAIKVIGSQRDVRLNDALDDMTVNEVLFNNEVQFSNEDCRVVYDILMFFGYLKPDEECASRDKARFVKQLMARSKVVKMACLYRTDRGASAERNLEMICECGAVFSENSSEVTSGRNNSVFANTSKI